MASDPSSSLSELVQAMEEAILSAKQLPYSSNDPTRLNQIQSSLLRAHSRISAVLSTIPPAPEEPSLSSSGEPMQVDDGPDERIIDGVEETLRRCFIRTKRPKRRLSPDDEGDDEGLSGAGGIGIGVGDGFDPYATRSRALELVYQFHA